MSVRGLKTQIEDGAIACLEISSWSGISMGAEHLYGSICYYNAEGEYKKHTLKYPMTKELAETLNKKDGQGSDWEAGELTDRYESTNQIRDDAVKCFREMLEPQGCNILVEGSFATAQPQPVLAWAQGYGKIACAFNDLYKKGKAVDWNWDKDCNLLEALCDEWKALIKYGN